jgi:thioester reductase-like protein
MAAASEKDFLGQYTEDFVRDRPVNLAMGYLKSKYEAEKILSSNRNNNFINIFRLGYISANKENGVCLYENNQLMLFIKSCIQLGFAPIIDRTINLTPVDFAASVLGAQFFRKNSNQILHLVNCSEYIIWIELIDFLNDIGYRIKLIELSKWQELLKKSGKSNVLFRMLLTYRRKDADDHIIRFGKNIHEYHINNIKNLCVNENIILPKIKYDYIKKIFDYLVEVGFLSNPKSICNGVK